MRQRLQLLLHLAVLYSVYAQHEAAAVAPKMVPQPVKPRPEPAQPKIAAGFESYNIFWPGETAEDGTVFACTYIPTLVHANHSRLIAHGSCGTSPTDCNGFHLRAQARAAVLRGEALPPAPVGSTAAGNPIAEGRVCQKHSDDVSLGYRVFLL